MTVDEQVRQKQLAAERAVEHVQSGMVVGLGTGSTAIFATRRIAQLLSTGQLKNITGIATSRATGAEAQRLSIPLLTDDLPNQVDITIDGADEIDPQLNLIKGGGGALLREKIVAQASHRVIIVADESKLSQNLGTRFKLPVEVLQFGWRSQSRYLESLGAKVEVRQKADGSQFMTDSGNLILDCNFGPIADPLQLASYLNQRAGIVEHGLFLNIATEAIIAGPAGIRHLTIGT
ncbi:MAG: ribose-5-phosphate isomerase RpiA [Acidobacteriota bacterium]